MQEVDPQEVFRVIADTEMVFQRAFVQFSLCIAEVFYLILHRGVLNGGKPDWLDREGAPVFFGASVISLLFGNALVAAIPVVCGQKVQRITNECDVDLTGALIFQKRDCFAMQKQPVREIGLDPGGDLCMFLGLAELSLPIGDVFVFGTQLLLQRSDGILMLLTGFFFQLFLLCLIRFLARELVS